MRLVDLFEKNKKKPVQPQQPVSSVFAVELTNKYEKTKETLSKSDPILKKNILVFEMLATKGPTRSPEEEELYKNRFNAHIVKFSNSRKGQALFNRHNQAGFRMWQAHIPSTQTKGRYVMAYSINNKSKIIRFILVGTHDDTTGG